MAVFEPIFLGYWFRCATNHIIKRIQFLLALHTDCTSFSLMNSNYVWSPIALLRHRSFQTFTGAATSEGFSQWEALGEALRSSGCLNGPRNGNFESVESDNDDMPLHCSCRGHLIVVQTKRSSAESGFLECFSPRPVGQDLQSIQSEVQMDTIIFIWTSICIWWWFKVQFFPPCLDDNIHCPTWENLWALWYCISLSILIYLIFLSTLVRGLVKHHLLLVYTSGLVAKSLQRWKQGESKEKRRTGSTWASWNWMNLDSLLLNLDLTKLYFSKRQPWITNSQGGFPIFCDEYYNYTTFCTSPS